MERNWMVMGKKYLLPPLLEESEIKNDDCWEDFENPYEFLIKKMKLQNEPNTSIFEGGSNAVPHVYEQMILFHDAFFDEKHLEHERAVIEWKSILILLAVQRIQNIDISLKKVEFNEQSENPFLRAALTEKLMDLVASMKAEKIVENHPEISQDLSMPILAM